jgi:hypothetical protein
MQPQLRCVSEVDMLADRNDLAAIMVVELTDHHLFFGDTH